MPEGSAAREGPHEASFLRFFRDSKNVPKLARKRGSPPVDLCQLETLVGGFILAAWC